MAHELKELETWGKLTFHYALVGVLVGLGIVLFFFALNFFSPFFLHFLGNLGAYEMPAPAHEKEFFRFNALFGRGVFSSPLLLLLLASIPAFGGILVGILKFRFIEAERASELHETGVFIDAFHNKRGEISAKEGFLRGVCSVLTISTGGSAGREGPSAMLGATIGSLFGRIKRLKFSERERRRLVAAGAGAGIAAIFKSPLGGAFFGIETLYRRDMEVEALIPALICSISAYIVSCSFLGLGHIYEMREYDINFLLKPIPLAFFLLLGMLCVPFSIFFAHISALVKDFFFRRLKRVPNYFKPALGGLSVGCVFLLSYILVSALSGDEDAELALTSGILGGGYGFIQLAFYGNLSLAVLVCVAVAKILATSLTLGSGGSGGSFIPSLTVGAALGGMLGEIFRMLFPGMGAEPWVFALVGAAAFFAAAANAPLTSLFVVCEISGSYELFVPALLAIVPAYMLSGKWTIYPEQTETRRESPAHRREFFVDLLEGIRVAEACTKARDLITIPEDMTVAEALHFAEEHGHVVYPVVNEWKKMVGIVSIPDLERAREEGKSGAKVGEICVREVVVAYPDEFLEDALQRMEKYGVGRLPVVKREDATASAAGVGETGSGGMVSSSSGGGEVQEKRSGEMELLGIITRADIIREHCRRRSLIYRSF
ncbi:MAG: chloride channel protein [Methanophagales archaeon]|nr:chloride channel protein [Methanophagales archaeon]